MLETEALGPVRRQVVAAYESVRYELLSERESSGHWIGELSSSALSTATAVSALALVERHSPTDPCSGRISNESESSRFCELIVGGLKWLAEQQNADGGWADTPGGLSNIATTMLVQAAFHLTGVPADRASLLERAEEYVQRQGGIAGLKRRYGEDKTFAVPILTNCALAGMVPWRQVSPLPFEAACVPAQWYRFLQLPVVSYAIPALVAIGQARFHHRRPFNPVALLVRNLSRQKSLRRLETLQPLSGGFLEATPLTSFVVMSLASIGHVRHPVARKGVEFLVASVRPDGSWPIDTNLAVWNTTLSLNALAAGGEDVAELGCLDWLLSCQNRQMHPYTEAAPGGWGWSDLSGSVPDADDTAGALLALAAIYRSTGCSPADRKRIVEAVQAGVGWLLSLQNRDGGWPTFCRGWGKLPFDRSGSDLTAHALRALEAWRGVLCGANTTDSAAYRGSLGRAMARGLEYLHKSQHADGSWRPLWFGNPYQADESNPVYGTAKAIFALRDLGLIDTEPARRGLQWLLGAQSGHGGWGSRTGIRLGEKASGNGSPSPSGQDSIEETALAVEALLSAPPAVRAKLQPSLEAGLEKGLACLIQMVQQGRIAPSPIGFYFAKLWYYEKLYPLSFAASALGRAVQQIGDEQTEALRPVQAARVRQSMQAP